MELIGFGIMALIFTVCCFFWKRKKWDPHHRGRRVLSQEEAQEVAKKLLPPGDPGIFLGGIIIPSSAAAAHFAVIGATGSGKTITIKLLMQSILNMIIRGNDQRALIYDAKQDIIPWLAGLNPACRVETLHPFDQRGVAWDMAADCTSPAIALEIASILIPEENSAQPFFADASRHLLCGILVSFMRTCPGAWTFRDVILTAKSKKRTREVLSRTAETQDLLEYFEEEKTAANIFASMATKMARFEPIAAAWSKALKSISLEKWAKTESILVLGSDESVRSALDAINQVIVKRVSEILLSQSESTTRRSWLIFDEVRQAGDLDGLSQLLTKGRSKGVCAVLGFQDIEGMREVYGDNVANELVGQCGNKAILRLDSPATAEWAAQVFGERELWEKSTTTAGGQNGSHDSTNWHIVKRESVLASEFQSLLATNPANGLHGYYLTPQIGAYKSTLPGNWISQALIKPRKDIDNIVPRDVEDQYLAPWTDEDRKRLGLPTSDRNKKAPCRLDNLTFLGKSK